MSQKFSGSALVRAKVINSLVIIVSAALLAVTFVVLGLLYNPNQNAYGALASVSMDVICMLVLFVLIVNLTFGKDELSRTTRLYLALIMVTMFAVFFDFLNWAFDGSLVYGESTYVFTVSSLCCGSILAGIFVFYLSSYLEDMYGLKLAFRRAKILGICNLIAFDITLALGITKTAFTYVDGHYQVGELYDVITVIPIITLIAMSVYACRNRKLIGTHDVISVSGYIVIMIVGALVEAVFVMGTTYVAVTISDLFIFVMLQNKVIDRAEIQKGKLTEKISTQFEILSSMAEIYSHVNYLNLENCTARRFDQAESMEEGLDLINDPHTSLNKELFEGIEDDLKEKFWTFTNLATLSNRLNHEKVISAEFCHKEDGWFRAQYIRIGSNLDETLDKVIYTIRNIDEEKKNVEKWIRRSNTDELTGFSNRHAYEAEIAKLKKNGIEEDFVYVSMDVNSLKLVNDSLGHEAGDELLVGACECMKQCFEAYGKLFRIGGDEFVALIHASNAEVEQIKKSLEVTTERWRGKHNDDLTISSGYVTRTEAKDLSLHKIAVLADKRMYEDKSQYYRRKGIDRRGQRDAHVALCALYTKILKINVTDDTYQIVNMLDENEQTVEKGFSDQISKWLYDFGISGQVHPDDLEEYLSRTSLAYISGYFKRNKNSLCVFYRRKYGDVYKKVMMEMIPANDYSDEAQNLYLYVKNIEQ